MNAIYNKDKLVVFANARSGTGKTTLSIATALIMVKYGMYDGITYIVSPCMENELGFRPGTATEKILDYATPLYQALIECGEQPEKVIISDGAASVKDGAFVELLPHTFLRGSNLKNRVVILEECQNMSIFEIKRTLTRVADTSKVIVIGHDGQRDAYRNGESAFARYIEHFRPDGRAAVCNLTRNYRGWISSHADEL